MPDDIVIPDKPAFKAAEVCELLKVPPYVLRSWENEFKDLGVAKTASGPRVYRRQDVERALRIRHLVLQEGLTLAGVRRRLEQESGAVSAEDELIAEIVAAAEPAVLPPASSVPAVVVSDRAAVAWRTHAEQLRVGLREVLDLLSRPLGASPVGLRKGAPKIAGVLAADVPGRADAPRQAEAREPRQAPAARELVIEPEPTEPSLFAEGDDLPPADVSREPDVAPRGRRRSGGRGPAH